MRRLVAVEAGEEPRKPVPRRAWAALSFALPAAAYLSRPFGLGPEQAILLGVLAQVVLAWTLGFARRDVASAWLLACSVLVGDASVRDVFTFPLSGNFPLVASAFLLSAAISKSGLDSRLVALSFSRFARSPRGLVQFSFVAGAALSLIIPQPFPRVIVLSSLYAAFLEDKATTARLRRAVLLSVFVASTGTSMLFKGGDVILNSSAVSFAGASLGYARWALLMLVPSLAVTLASYAVIVTVFKVPRTPFRLAIVPEEGPGKASAPEPARRLSGLEARVAVIVLALVACWATEPLHGVPAAWSAVAAVAALFSVKALGLRDLRSVEPSLMLFLTAAFSIGRVLAANGIADRLSGMATSILPEALSARYYLAMAAVVMALHLALGSSLTTMSVAIPGLVAATRGAVPPELVGLFAYSVVTMQYFLPIQHVTLMIGSGKGYYTQRDTLAFGAIMALVVPLYAAFVLVPWWRLVGAL